MVEIKGKALADARTELFEILADILSRARLHRSGPPADGRQTDEDQPRELHPRLGTQLRRAGGRPDLTPGARLREQWAGLAQVQFVRRIAGLQDRRSLPRWRKNCRPSAGCCCTRERPALRRHGRGGGLCRDQDRSRPAAGGGPRRSRRAAPASPGPFAPAAWPKAGPRRSPSPTSPGSFAPCPRPPRRRRH